MIAADEDRLERVRDNIDAAENEYVKYADMITDKKNKLEMLTSKENELVERTKIAENVYDMFRHGGDDDVREKLIDVMYENQRLQKENKSLKELLEKAYDFMKQFVIDGVNLLEKFMESVRKVMERLSPKQNKNICSCNKVLTLLYYGFMIDNRNGGTDIMRKSISISIRVSEDELEKFKEAARLEAYASYSEFVRRTALIEATRIIKENNEGENTYEHN